MPLRDVDVPRVLERLGIEARRQGRELWARCPFHDERSPSWRVRDEPAGEHHAVWQCFGACPEGARSGSIVVLVQRLVGLRSRSAAWRWIKEKGAETPARPAVRVEVVVHEEPGPLALPAGVRVAPVAEWVTPARRYLVEERGVPAEQAERWGLGFAPDGKLAGRIVIPVCDAKGRLLNYTARTYLGSAKKFREPDKGDGADKGAVFGERHWPPPGARALVVLAEAALDALGVERATGLPVAAVYGSELLPGHLARLSTFAEIVVASDPDDAGNKLHAAIRSQLGRFSRVRRATLPEGEDGAALAKSDPARLAAIVRAAA